MSNVSLQIGGRSYTVNCAAGEEEHVTRLGQVIDQKVQSMGGGHNEVRQLLFAALILADELHEARSGHAPAPAAAPPPAAPDHSAALEALADRLEKCATALEG
ncbi:cell division protein ZapA [Novosphingobium sp.]|uniref:cell division protein ZapA n=1 Tax=Novosphingobium sp. TaxID=1874826 RepID=UPI0035B0D4C9